MQYKKVDILGFSIASVDFNDVVTLIEELINDKNKGFIVTANILTVVEALRDENYRQILHKAKIILPDGMGVVFASKILGERIKLKISGIDLIPYIFKLACKKNYGLFLIGAKEKVIAKAVYNLKLDYPEVNICGFTHGFEKDEKELLRKIQFAKPDIILVGMGQPKQEKWLAENLNKTGAIIGIGIGGSFDVIAKKVKRAPHIIQAVGLEWFYRGIQEPKRFKRYIWFVWFFILLFKQKFNKGSGLEF